MFVESNPLLICAAAYRRKNMRYCDNFTLFFRMLFCYERRVMIKGSGAYVGLRSFARWIARAGGNIAGKCNCARYKCR